MSVHIFYGPDYCRQLDFNLLIGWDERKKLVPGGPRFNKSIEIYGNWIPTFWWVNARQSKDYDYDSSAWTGRDYRFMGWSWPIGFRFVNHTRLR